MQKQKRGFWLFIFSLIPGAGEMYMGFKKQGISIMFLFWGVFAIGACTGMDWLVFLIPIIWFYSFFNVHNKKDLIEFDNGNMNTQEVIEFLSHLDHCDFCLDQMMEQEDSSTDTAPSYLMEQILDKADSGEVQLARAANKASRKIRLLHYSLQTAAGVMVALLLLFSIPNLDFTSLHQDTFSQTDRILPEHENGRLYQFTRELGQNIGDGTGSFIKYISDFSGKLMNGGK